MLTKDQLKSALPAQVTKSLNQELVDKINSTLKDPEAMEIYKENLLTFSNVLQQGKFKLESYLNAVRYVSFKLMGHTNKKAYIKTFPDKYQDFLKRNVSQKDIASYITAYNKSKLVNIIMEQALVPTHVLNAPLFQQAINAQAMLMMNAKSEKVRCDAANSLLTHLKQPETAKVELDLNVNQGSVIDDYQVAIRRMTEAQLELMKKGGDIKQIANAAIPKSQEVIEAEATVVDTSEDEQLFG